MPRAPRGGAGRVSRSSSPGASGSGESQSSRSSDGDQHRHAVVDRSDEVVRVGGEDRAGVNGVAERSPVGRHCSNRPPNKSRPEPGGPEAQGLLATRAGRLLRRRPLVEGVGGDDAALLSIAPRNMGLSGTVSALALKARAPIDGSFAHQGQAPSGTPRAACAPARERDRSRPAPSPEGRRSSAGRELGGDVHLVDLEQAGDVLDGAAGDETTTHRPGRYGAGCHGAERRLGSCRQRLSRRCGRPGRRRRPRRRHRRTARTPSPRWHAPR